MFSKILFILKNWSTVDHVIRETKDRNEQLVKESKRHNLNLCFKHKQRYSSKNYSSHNCDYCIKENQLKELNDRYKEQKIKHSRDLHEARKPNGNKTSQTP